MTMPKCIAGMFRNVPKQALRNESSAYYVGNGALAETPIRIPDHEQRPLRAARRTTKRTAMKRLQPHLAAINDALARIQTIRERAHDHTDPAGAIAEVRLEIQGLQIALLADLVSRIERLEKRDDGAGIRLDANKLKERVEALEKPASAAPVEPVAEKRPAPAPTPERDAESPMVKAMGETLH